MGTFRAIQCSFATLCGAIYSSDWLSQAQSYQIILCETLTFQIINTAQPALLSLDASKNLGVPSFDADFVRTCTLRAANKP
jgi:hypothetical protein